jgi:hypothetical protein
MLSFNKMGFPLDEVKASQMNKLQAGPYCNFSSARAFTFVQRIKKLNIVGFMLKSMRIFFGVEK